MNTSAPDPGQARLQDSSRMECRICWYVYDPEEGDPVEQVPAGTPFLEPPGHLRCPQYDVEPGAFLTMKS